MKFNDIPPHISDILPRVGDDENVVPLFHLDYYDGVLTGIITIADEHYLALVPYYNCRDVCLVFKLNPDETDQFLKNHKAFQEYVGYHTDYFKNASEDYVRYHGMSLKPVTEWDKFYKNPEYQKDTQEDILQNREIDGWTPNPFL